VNYVFLVGASAGGVIVAAMGHALGKEKYRSVSRMAELIAIGTLLMALTFILVDIGQPYRGWHIILYANLGSPFIWNLTIIAIYLAIAALFGYLGTRAEVVKLSRLLPRRRTLYRALALWRTRLDERTAAKERRALKTLAIVTIPAAVTLHSVTAWIFGTIKAQAAWHSAIMAPLFVASAVASGLGLVIMAALFFRWRYGFKEIDDALVRDLGKNLLYVLPIVAYLLLAEFITVAYAREGVRTNVMNSIVFGDYAPVFWFDMVVGILLPIAILVFAVFRSARPSPPVGLAALFATVGVFAERIDLVLPSFRSKLVSSPVVAYFPTAGEILVTLGIWCAGLLVFALLSKVFPMVEHGPDAVGEEAGEPAAAREPPARVAADGGEDMVGPARA
jgi:molybdopterin-containing oxidoreductase family membrane subunit